MNRQSKFLTKVVPMALTILGAASTVAAVIFAAKEGPKYQKILEEDKEMSTPKKVVKAVKTFAPAIGCTAVSVACGIGAHCLDMSTQASLTGAYIAAQGGFKKLKGEYKRFRDKNRELNGEEANEKVIKEMQKEDLPVELRDENGEKIYNVNLRGLSESLPVITMQSSKADIFAKILQVQFMLDKIGMLSLNDMLDIFDQPHVEFGDEEGWSYEMISEWDCATLLKFEIDIDENGDLNIYPIFCAYGGYLTDYGIDY